MAFASAVRGNLWMLRKHSPWTRRASHRWIRRKSKADIIELLVRNPDLELDEVRRVCTRYGLGGLEELIAESRSL